MKDAELKILIEKMKVAGCSEADADRVTNMHKAGLDEEIMHYLRKCRCSLMEDLRESQKRVDRMDHLILEAENY